MRLVIQAGMVSIEGKYSEHDKIEKIMLELGEDLGIDTSLVNDSDEDDNLTDISLPYDQDEFTIEQVKKLYKQVKKG